ncbi:MAG: sensor domain-containing diguanylate cyclase [Thermoleophilia bacterium]
MLLGALTLVVAAVGVAILLGPLAEHSAPPWHGIRLTWWMLAPAFLLAEQASVDIGLRGRWQFSFTFSFTELPLVMGLVFATPIDVVSGELVGSLVALMLLRRQRGLRLAFNLAQFMLTTCISAVMVHEGLEAWASPPPQVAWLLVSLGVLVGNTIGSGLVTLAVVIHQRSKPSRWLVIEAFVVGSVTVLTTTFFGLACAELTRLRPWALVLLLPAALVLVVAYRAYARDRRRQERTEELYRWMQRVHAASDIGTAMSALLEEARSLFRADVVSILLLPGAEHDGALRSVSGPGDHLEILVPAEDTVMPGVRAERPTLMRAPLQADSRDAGMVVVERTASGASAFDASDRALLDTYVSHAGLALENGRLERSLTDLSRTSERLAVQAFTDPLTGLGNRALLMDRVRAALARDGARPVGLLLMDLDGFKSVNDRYGHAAGDRLLTTVAERVRACVRPIDTIGRLGGDEFLAVLEVVEGVTEAREIAGRLERAVWEPIDVGGGETVNVGLSVGVAVGIPGQVDADELLDQADRAMYARKAVSVHRGR